MCGIDRECGGEQFKKIRTYFHTQERASMRDTKEENFLNIYITWVLYMALTKHLEMVTRIHHIHAFLYFLLVGRFFCQKYTDTDNIYILAARTHLPQRHKKKNTHDIINVVVRTRFDDHTTR